MTRVSLHFAAIAALFTAGCNREDVRVSLQPKDSAPPPTVAAGAPESVAERPHPHFTWTLPAGWEEAEQGQMSVANFNIKTDAGQATVSITPLPNLAGKEALIVNMWREQVGAAPLDPAEALKALTQVDVAGGKGQLFEISGTKDGKPMQIVTAMAQAANASWFYKLSGDEPVVSAQKPAFLEFLKSVRMQPETQQPASVASAMPTSPPEPVAPATTPEPPAAPAIPSETPGTSAVPAVPAVPPVPAPSAPASAAPTEPAPTAPANPAVPAAAPEHSTPPP